MTQSIFGIFNHLINFWIQMSHVLFRASPLYPVDGPILTIISQWRQDRRGGFAPKTLVLNYNLGT